MNISILIAAVAVMWGLYCIGKGLCELADAIRYAARDRSIVIERDSHRDYPNTYEYRFNVRIK